MPGGLEPHQQVLRHRVGRGDLAGGLRVVVEREAQGRLGEHLRGVGVARVAAGHPGVHGHAGALPDEVDGEPRLLTALLRGPLPLLDPALQEVAHRRDLGGDRQGADGGDRTSGVAQRLQAGVVAVAEVRAVRRQGSPRPGDHERVDRRQRQQPVAQVGVAVRLAGDGTGRAALRTGLLLAAGHHRVAHLLGAAHRGDRGVEGAAGEGRVRAHHAAQRDRLARPELLHGEPRTEVVRDGVEATGVHDPRTAGDRGLVVLEVHLVDELRLTGQVDVVGAGLRAGGDQRLRRTAGRGRPW